MTQSTNPDDKNGNNQAPSDPYFGQQNNFTSNPTGNNDSQFFNPNSGGRNGFRGRGSRGGRFRGRGGRNFGRGGSVQCQICYKMGHDASICYHRLSVSPQYEGYGAFGGIFTGYGGSANGFGHYGPPPNVWLQGASPRTPSGPSSRPSFPAQHGNFRPPPPQAYLTGNESINSNSLNTNWYPDSGATHHVTPDATNLMDAVSLSGSDQVHIGNGQGLPINSIGSLSFTSPFSPHTTFTLHNLLHVPSITKNLVSVSQFCRDNNVFFEFHPNTCCVKSQGSSKILLKGHIGVDGLYQFDNTSESQTASTPTASSSSFNSKCQANECFSYSSFPISKSQCNNIGSTSTPISSSSNHSNSTVSSLSMYKVWHNRLGHPSHEVIKNVLKLCNQSLPNKVVSDFCSACCLGKSHRLPSVSSSTTYHKPFELVFCDLWGPASVESHGGFSYFLTCVDAYSRYTWIFPLKLKSQTLLMFKNFKSMVELQYNLPIKSVQTDGGGEFRPLTQFLTTLGITHRLTCPHTHHQNGSVERKHRHIVETGLTLLANAKLPLCFWDHAFLTATYLINRLPSPTLDHKSPFFMLHLQFPDYNFLKSFGCACFPFTRPYNNNKLEFRSKECVFLGYSPSHKGYKCLDSAGRLYISKDVIFNEYKFPYAELFSCNQPSTTSDTSHPFTTFPIAQLPTYNTSSVNTPSPSNTAPIQANSEHFSSHHTELSQSPLQHNTPLNSTSTHSSPNLHHLPPGPILNPEPLTVLPPSSLGSVSSASQSHNFSQSSTDSSTTSAPPSPHAPPHRIHPNNTHNMATRGKHGIVQKRIQPTLLLTHLEPTSYKQAMKDTDWLHAMNLEYDALMKNNTWTLVHPPPNRKAVGCKWVFRVKQNLDGSINKYKARLVAKGFNQMHGFDYKETFSPVVKPVTVRTVLTLAVTNKWCIQQLDINNAFLNGFLEEEVYMTQPPGFEKTDTSLVCKLNKALYGLKQAPRAWFERLKSTLLKFGFCASKCDPSLFTLHTQHHTTLILVYVDDIIITGSSKSQIQQLVQKLNSEFSLKDLGQLDYFLGIEVHHSDNGSLLLSQTKYIHDLLVKANMANANSIASPMASSTKLSKYGSNHVSDPTFFRSIVGGLQYATVTRPEISYSVNKVCQFLSAPLEDHWKAVKRILRYLQGTLHHGLLISPAPIHEPLTLTGFCDADWASDPDDRRSTSGACVFLGPNLISWWAKKQTLVARSSAEAEYRSLAQASSEILWLQSLLQELKVPIKVPQIFCDNLSAVSLAHNPVLHSRTKHMELDIFFVREKVLSKNLLVSHVPASLQWADILTKPLSTSRFLELRTKLRVTDLLSLRGEC